MNKTNFQHAFAGILIHLIIGFGTGDWFAGFAVNVGVWLCREFTQHEYKIYTWGPKTGRAFYKGWLGWSLDNCLDALFPIFSSFVIYVISYFNPIEFNVLDFAFDVANL